MQILTPLLPAELSNSVELACCKIADRYSENVLARHEKVVCSSFGSASRRREYLATRWLIREMAKCMNLAPNRFLVKKGSNGRPYAVYNSKRYYVSIAHSKSDTICAISPTTRIGVDLEPQNRSVSEHLLARLLNESEQSLLAGEDTIRLWTLKEAILKLHGSGLRTRLKDWVIISKNKTSFMAEYEQKEQIQIYSFSYQNNWIAVAFNPKKKPLYDTINH